MNLKTKGQLDSHPILICIIEIHDDVDLHNDNNNNDDI